MLLWTLGHMYLFKSVFIFFGYISSNGIARLYGSYIFRFWGSSILFSTVAAPIYIPTDSVKEAPFLHILKNNQDGKKRCCAHLLPQEHPNHNCLQNNHWRKRWEPIRKDLLQYKEGTAMRLCGLPQGSAVKNPPAMQESQETWVPSQAWEDALEDSIATHLAWRIPRTEEPGGQQTIRSHRVR